MNERDRLIEILSAPIFPRIGADPAEVVADYLLDNGVIVPPVKVGQTVWIIHNHSQTICEGEIVRLTYNKFTTPQEWIEYKFDSPYSGETANYNRIDLCLGKTVFLTREEAEQALKERSEQP